MNWLQFYFARGGVTRTHAQGMAMNWLQFYFTKYMDHYWASAEDVERAAASHGRMHRAWR